MISRQESEDREAVKFISASRHEHLGSGLLCTWGLERFRGGCYTAVENPISSVYLIVLAGIWNVLWSCRVPDYFYTRVV